ncbi:MAG: tRNA preQ1(34) S-adenosylmethionine ribosyltransferase-isomerase QueA [Desulfovibrionaceae bacterium]
MSDIPPDFHLHSYRYHLEQDRIAQVPADRRDASRLCVLDRATGGTRMVSFADLPDLLPEGALVVANNARVLPARIHGRKPTGGRVEFLLLTPLPLIGAGQPVAEGAAGPEGTGRQDGQGAWREATVEGLLKASKGFKPGDTVAFAPDCRLTVAEVGDFGRCRVALAWQGDLAGIFCRIGSMPLPPYIKREACDTGPGQGDGDAACAAQARADAERYQTVYAARDKLGSVAAPTAGLHFTPEVRARMAARGMAWAEATLYVGYGTFSPVRCLDVREHAMHPEYVELGEATARAVTEAKAAGRPVVAVGTTSVRTLEGIHNTFGAIRSWSGWLNLYVYPGFTFRVVDHMVTNFHLPESSLLLMVSAFAGRERILAAYAEALRAGFRVFSYGDSMLLL